MPRPCPRTAFVAALAAGAALAGAPAAAQDLPPRPPLAATVSSCQTGLTADERAVVFTGSMPAIRRAVRMSMRFELYERAGETGPYVRVRLSGFGNWVRADPGVAGFVYAKRVEQLAAPSAYRVLVRFRWYDARGRVVRRRERTSAGCRQPDLRPDLRVARLLIGAARPDGSALYTVTVRNAGRSAVSAPFTTGLSIDGVAQPVEALGGLDVNGTATVVFVGPRCAAGAAVIAVADADATVDEVDEYDNTERRSCPDAPPS